MAVLVAAQARQGVEDFAHRPVFAWLIVTPRRPHRHPHRQPQHPPVRRHRQAVVKIKTAAAVVADLSQVCDRGQSRILIIELPS